MHFLFLQAIRLYQVDCLAQIHPEEMKFLHQEILGNVRQVFQLIFYILGNLLNIFRSYSI